MVISVSDGIRTWNARVIPESKMPSKERLVYQFSSCDVGDHSDEKEYKIYKDSKEGTLIAVPPRIY